MGVLLVTADPGQVRLVSQGEMYAGLGREFTVL